MKLSSKLIICLLISFCITYGRDVVFIGLNETNAPALGKTYDRILREQLAVTPDIQLTDYVKSERFKQAIHFENYPVVSTELISALSKYVPDTTYFIWGMIKEYKITPVRHFLVQARLEGELSITLNMYSLADHSIAYSGNIKATIYKSKGLIFFGSISEQVHVSALDQTDLLEKLEYEVAKKSTQMISAVVQSKNAKEDKNNNINKYEVKTPVDSTNVQQVKDTSTTKKDTSTTKKDTSTTKKDTSTTKKDTSTTKKDTSTTKIVPSDTAKGAQKAPITKDSTSKSAS